MWKIVKELYPTESWWKRLYRWFQFEIGWIPQTSSSNEIPIEQLHADLLAGRFGGPGIILAKQYTYRGKVISEFDKIVG